MTLSTAQIIILGVFLVLPWAVLLVAGRAILKAQRAAIEGAGDEIAAKVRAAVAGAVEEALPKLRAEVEGGVRDGAGEALPRVREQVRDGVSEAVASALSGGLVGKAGEELVRKGGGILDALLGSRRDDEES